jgi:anti-sigma B factor antagonist
VRNSLLIDTVVEDETVGVIVRGEVEVFTAPELVAAFDAALEGPPSWVILDLEQVSFSDSTGLVALVRCRRRAAAGVELSLACGDGPVRRLLHLSGLVSVFSMV